MKHQTMVALLALAACSTQPSHPPFAGPASSGGVVDAIGKVAPRMLRATLADQPSPGRMRIMHGPTSCISNHVGQGNPVVLPGTRQPRAGEPFSVEWRVNPTEPYEENRPAFLLAWFGDSKPTDLSPWGYTGCTLWAPLDPTKIATLATDGERFRQVGGRITLTMTPPTSWSGLRLACQLVVFSPGANSQAWLLSPGLEIWL